VQRVSAPRSKRTSTGSLTLNSVATKLPERKKAVIDSFRCKLKPERFAKIRGGQKTGKGVDAIRDLKKKESIQTRPIGRSNSCLCENIHGKSSRDVLTKKGFD